MRVLYLMDDVGGGTGNHILALLPLLKGVEPVFATTGRTVRSRLASAGPEIFRVPPKRWYEFPVLHQIRMYSDLVRFARDRNVDVIHTYFFWSIFFGRLLKRRLGVRLLVENREDLGFQWGRFEYGLLRFRAGEPDRVVCVADEVRRRVLARERVAPEKLTVIHNGLAPAAAGKEGGDLRAELGIPPGVPVIGAVANFRTVKRLDRLIRASRRIRERLPGARVVLAGRGTEEEGLRKLTTDLGLEGTVLFAGYRTDVDSTYRTFDVTVLTSESEGCSITILESFDAGVPVVVTDVGGNGELVADGENGFLVPEWNEPLFVDRVARILEDGDLRRRLGEAGRTRVRDRHAMGEVAERYLRVYRGE
ncbi:MAG: glycosyltransferase family 4 protein [Candidatus Eisenbacteria bacterium]